jgi:hypothetical protein
VKVSVVTPLYNKAATIVRTIESVRAQTHADFEMIIVDDGSTDRSGELARQIKDPRIRVISQTNAGVSAARNRGIAEATTEWVAFLDGDDAWRPTFLERTVALIERHPDVGAVIVNFWKDLTKKTQVPPGAAPEGVPPDFFALALAAGTCPASSSSIMVRRQALLAVGAFPVGALYGEDVDLWNRLACQYPIGYIPEPLADIYGCLARTPERMHRETYPLPLTVTTLRGPWASRIPQRLEHSVREYINLALMLHVEMYFCSEKVKEGFHLLLTQCRPTRHTWRKYLRVWCSGLLRCTPSWFRSLYRRWAHGRDASGAA